MRVEVIRSGTDSLEVSWELAGEGPVEIAVGLTPQSIAHNDPVCTVAGTTHVSLHGLGTQRRYVSVGPAGGGSAIMAAERRLPLKGTVNLRDLGGYSTIDGGLTRWGLVFRSDVPYRLTDADLVIVGQLNLRVVYDLRTELERGKAPSALPASVRRELLAIGEDSKTREVIDVIKGKTRVSDEFFVRIYQTIADIDAPLFGRLLTGLADPSSLPALFHCTSGKDRTGMGAALLLSALGVDEAIVLDDYELSTVYLTERWAAIMRPRMARLGVDVERYRGAVIAPRLAMASALAVLRERYGTINSYLVKKAGVRPETLTKLRARLVESRG